MTDECITCPGHTCMNCGEHVHDWDGEHACHTAARRRFSAALAQFESGLSAALAVHGGVIHAVDCRTVKAHIGIARNIIAGDEPAYCNWHPWPLVHEQRVIGYTGQCCSPPVLVQRPTPQRRLVRRLTGIGWPGDDGRCPKGRLPLWTREGS